MRDRALAEALVRYEHGVNQYGVLYKDALDPDTEGFYEVDFVTDLAAEAVESARSKETSRSAIPIVRFERPKPRD